MTVLDIPGPELRDQSKTAAADFYVCRGLFCFKKV